MLAANQLPAFDPIEASCLGWEGARDTVGGSIPRWCAYRISSTHPDRLEIDANWAMTLLDQCPIEYRKVIVQRLNLINMHVADVLPEDRLSTFRFEPANQVTLDMINVTLKSIDHQRQRDGSITFHQMLSHIMGIAPATPQIPTIYVQHAN